MTETKKTAKRASAKDATYEGFTADERAAMKDRAKELKASARRGSRAAAQDGENDVVAKLAEMQGSDRVIGERLHELIKASAPELTPKLWYGMPAYAKDGKLVCFYQNAQKFKSRYAMLGFSDAANLDDGDMWPAYYAVNKLTPDVEARVAALVKQAVS